MAAEPPHVLCYEHITRRFPGVIALEDVSFGVRRGECHALLGENGAGKSTLGRITAGILEPSEGRLLLEGQPVRFAVPRDAMRAGIRMVHQELCLCPNLTVAENLCLGDLPSRRGLLDRRAMRRHARSMLSEVGAVIDVDARLGSLSIAAEQLVQIAGAVGGGARVIVMDEPTSSLALSETERLFGLIGRLKERGVTILYVSHRLEEIFRICDRITVLRDGRHIITADRADLTMDQVVRQMIGRSVEQYFPGHLDTSPGAEKLRVEGLCSPGRFENVSFSVHTGEVVGLAGLVGAGRSEVARAIFGLDPAATGGVYVNGAPVAVHSPNVAMKKGIGYLPEDRKTQGLVLSLGGRANLTLPMLDRLSRAGFVRTGRERSLTQGFFDRLRVRARDMDDPVWSLSGGNQQKIAIARWLARQCDILIMDEPTRGVDIGAKAEIHALIDSLARDGAAIVLISSELPEVLNLSTRIVVLREGRCAGMLERAEANPEKLMRMMAGIDSRMADETRAGE